MVAVTKFQNILFYEENTRQIVQHVAFTLILLFETVFTTTIVTTIM